MIANATKLNRGTVVSVAGSVVDIQFTQYLPPIFSLLKTDSLLHADSSLNADNANITIEVLTHLDAHRVRGIALTPTQCLARGMAVIDTGGPLLAPVGKSIRSRMFDVFGNTIDRGPALENVKWQSIHKPKPKSRNHYHLHCKLKA